jgi:polyphenol oxidase
MLRLPAANLENIAGIGHGFFGRQGGVSQGLYASLNCGLGSGDARDAVTENRRRVQDTVGANTLLTLYQIHSAEAVVVAGPWDASGQKQADAFATNVPGLALAILTADCAPVLFADSEARVIGAAHAGWKGAEAGVIEQALLAMERLGAKRVRIAACVGPCISQANYEVGPEFRARFAAPAHARFFVPSDRAGHWRFDLEAFVTLRLEDAGVRNIARLAACTYAREGDFFSYLRATHRGETDYGRQLAAIALVP